MARAARRSHTLDTSLTRIHCISAHPDDNKFTIAGSVAAWAREGRDVVFCLVTSGGAGTNGHTPDNTGLMPIRERESWDAAKILGVKDLVFLGYQRKSWYARQGSNLRPTDSKSVALSN
jgi:LmbE family N-acetylglucosaminyl deacetylase